MINDLRKKFIGVAMSAVVIVFLVIVVTLNLVNYHSMNQRSNQIIEILKNNHGMFPMDNMGPGHKPGGSPFNRPGLNEETPFQTRFFTVYLNDDGSVKNVNLDQIFAVNESEASNMATTLYNNNKSNGYYGNYRYAFISDEMFYIFIDAAIERNSFFTTLWTSIIVSLVAIGVILGLVIIFSKKVFKPVEESYAKQKSFITNASHELKTPLAVINSCTDVIEMNNGEDKWTNAIRDQVSRLSNLTNDLVKLARYDEEDHKWSKKELNLSESAKEIWKPFIAVAESKEKKLNLDIDDNVKFVGDKEAFDEVLSILADNMMKYALDNSEMTLSLKKNHKIHIKSINKAQGYQKGQQNQLFDRFYRQDESRSEQSGYGIGLSMAKSIIEAHNGKVSAYYDGDNLIIDFEL